MQLRGTIRPSLTFDDDVTAEAIENALRQKNTEKIIRILTGICNAQRQMIRTPYKVRYGKDLETELKKQLSGDIEGFILSLIQTPTKQDVLDLHRAVKGLGTDEKLLIEIITSRSNEELEAIRNVYQSTYGRSLEAAIAGDTSGDFKRSLITMTQGARDESEAVDHYRASEIARSMNASKDKKGSEKLEAYIPLIVSNPTMINQISSEYEKLTGIELMKALTKEFSGDIKNLLLANLSLMNGRSSFFSELLKNTKSAKDYTRVLISRSEIDLATIYEIHNNTGKKIQDVQSQMFSSEQTILQAIDENFKGDMMMAFKAIIKGN